MIAAFKAGTAENKSCLGEIVKLKAFLTLAKLKSL